MYRMYIRIRSSGEGKIRGAKPTLKKKAVERDLAPPGQFPLATKKPPAMATDDEEGTKGVLMNMPS